MKHFILDESVIYSKEYNSYHFPTQYGTRPYYVKLKGDLKPDKNGILEDNTFNFVRSKYGDSIFVPCAERSMRAVVFAGLTGLTHEKVEIDEEFNLADIHYTYFRENSIGTELKVIAVLSPRKPLVVKYTNVYTGKVRVEYIGYNYYERAIERKSVDPSRWADLRKNTEIVDDYEYDIPKNITADYINNLDDAEREKINTWFEKYHSFLRDA